MGRKLTQGEVIVQFEGVHCGKYGYGKVKYIDDATKVEIFCKTHNNYFKQSPSNHKRGHGCPKCRDDKNSSLRKRTYDDFIATCKSLHGDRYNYDNSVYNGVDKPFSFFCNNCGHTTELTLADLHTKRGKQGCAVCSGTAPKKQDRGLFLKRLFYRFPHLKERNFSSFKYIKSNVKGEITCSSGHKFEMNPNTLYMGGWCPKCARHGFNVGKSATLYYLSLNNGNAYKIGITNRTVEERFNQQDLKKIKIIKTWDLDGQSAHDIEKSILSYYEEYKYVGENILSSGNTELFTKDVLNLDNK